MIHKLGLGTVLFGMDYGLDNQISKLEINSILDDFSSKGNYFLDTAREYGNSEYNIGSFITEKKVKLFISTKLKKINFNSNLEKDILDSVKESLNNLNLNKIDLLSLHQVDKEIIDSDCLWKVISELKLKNIINYFGVSVYDEDDIKVILNNHLDKIDYIQLPYSIIDKRFESLFKVLKLNNIKIVARSVFLRGYLTEKVTEKFKVNNYIQELYELNPQLKKYALKKLAFDFVYFNDYIDYVIFGVANKHQLNDLINLSNSKTIDFINIIWPKEISRDIYDPRKW